MEYRLLGRTGVRVTPLCLGTMNFGAKTNEADSIAIINRAIDGGINFIDTADMYSKGESERIVGKALAENGKRNRVVLATKVFAAMSDDINDRGTSRYHIIKACEDSLRRLQTDHIDLYQIHRPVLDLPQDETLRALDDLVRQGKVRYTGCSTFPAWMVMESLHISDDLKITRYISEQPPYNLLDRRIENELVPLAEKYGLAILPWSPLAGGILAGRYPLGADEFPEDSRAKAWHGFGDRVNLKGREVADAVAKMAKERDMTTSQLSLLWLKDQPAVTAPILGPRTMEHLEDALPLLEKTLADEDRPLFDELVHPGNVVTDFHDSNAWMKARIL